ncbi:hypothetical protein IZY60_02870 [Lutibacter sp. B2]|nr:hypothetical protein [Lutibacter sp. B2]
MKLNINKHLKVGLIIISIISLCMVSFLLYKAVNNPGFKDEKVSLYSYDHKTNVNYRVFLKPNILYSEESITEGNTYITEFVDYINTFFKYEFHGERVADIKGDYEITAVVEGYTGEGDTYKSIWKKNLILIGLTPFNSKDKTILIEKQIPLKLEKYNNFAEQVIKDTKIGCQSKITVFWNVNIKAETDKGLIEEKMSPTMIIPLNNNYFEIMGQLSQEKPENIEETKQVQLPVNKKIVVTYSVVAGILLIILTFLIFFTKAAVAMNPLEKKLKKIFKNHGDRLVALNNEVAITCENYNAVKSIDDLVRIADEIAKPIMYKYSADFKDMTEFYVFDDTQMYVVDLKNVLLEDNKEKKKSENDRPRFGKSLFKLKNKTAKKEEAETEKET